MHIGALSKRTGVAASRIRFYEKHAVLPPPVRGANGYREYADSAAAVLCLIDDAQRLGFSLSEIRAALGEAAPDLPSHAMMVKALRAKLASPGPAYEGGPGPPARDRSVVGGEGRLRAAGLLTGRRQHLPRHGRWLR